MTEFAENRWRRVGATDAEIRILRGRWSLMTPGQRAGIAAAIDSTSDDALRAQLNDIRRPRPDIPQEPVTPASEAAAAVRQGQSRG